MSDVEDAIKAAMYLLFGDPEADRPSTAWKQRVEQAIRHAVAVGIKAAHCCWMREGQECHPIDHPNVNPKDLCQGCRKAWDALTGHSGETVPKEAQ